MHVAGRIAKNFFSLLSARVIGQLIGFFVVVFVARKLGDAAFGQLSFAQILASYFMLGTNFGFTTLAIREVARERDKTPGYAGDVVTLRLGSSLLAFGILTGIAYLAGLSAAKRVLVIYYGLALFPESLNLSWVYIAHEKMEVQAAINIFRTVAYAVGVLLLLPRFAVPVIVAQMNLAAATLAAVVCITVYRRHFASMRLDRGREFWLSFLRRALPIGVMLLMFAVCYQFDTLMISFMKGNAMVGWYSAAYKIVMLLITVGSLFGMVLLPTLSSQMGTSVDSARSVMGGALRFMALMAMPLAIGGTVLSRRIIAAFFGSGYSNAALPFAILCWSVAIIYSTVVFTNALLALEKQKQLMVLVTLAALSNILLNFVAIPHFGLTGAAVTTCISEALILAGAYWMVRKAIPTALAPYLLKPTLASVAMGGVLVVVGHINILASVTCGIGTYLLILYAIGGICKEDLRFAKDVMVQR